MVNQVTPYGSLTYAQTGVGPGGVPLYTAATQLSPSMKALVDLLQGQSNASLTQGNYGNTNPGQEVGDATQGQTKQLLDTQLKYFDPFFKSQTNELDTKLRNQGLVPSQSSNPTDPNTWGPYEKAMNALRQSQGQTVTGAISQLEPLAYNQAKSNYLLPLNVTSSLMGLMNPSMVNAGLVNAPALSIQPPNYTGAAANYQEALNKQYEAQMAQKSAMLSGMFGIPSSILGGWARSGGVQGLMGSLGGLGGLGGEALGGAGAAAADGIGAAALELAPLAMV